MANISSFRALVAKKEKIKNFSIKSYIEYSKEEIYKKLKDNPISYLSIISSNKKTHTNHYDKIVKNLEKFKEKNILKTEEESIYIYQQITNKRTYTGIVCGVSTNDYKNGKIKIHEKTIEKRENLFKDYLSICKIHAEPILLTHESKENIKIYIQDKIKDKPYIKFKSKDNKIHILWKINSKAEISTIQQYFKSLNLYLADGHHRMASTLLYDEENNKNNNCLAYIISEDQINLESFHRIIKKVTKKQKLELLYSLKKNFSLIEGKANLLTGKNKVNIYLEKKWYNINFKSSSDKLIVQILSEKVLKPFFNIKNIRDSKMIKFIPESKFKLNKIDSNKNILFCLPPIKINKIFQFANKNQTMPPKSTYIRPKLRTGLLMLELK